MPNNEENIGKPRRSTFPIINDDEITVQVEKNELSTTMTSFETCGTVEIEEFVEDPALREKIFE